MNLASLGLWMFRLQPSGAQATPAWTAASPRPAAPTAHPGPPVRPLARLRTLRIEHPGGQAIECLSGTLWITQDGDPKDLILEAGERHAPAAARPLLVHALADALLTMGPA